MLSDPRFQLEFFKNNIFIDLQLYYLYMDKSKDTRTRRYDEDANRHDVVRDTQNKAVLGIGEPMRAYLGVVFAMLDSGARTRKPEAGSDQTRDAFIERRGIRGVPCLYEIAVLQEVFGPDSRTLP